MKNLVLDKKEYQAAARQMAAEGCVLLKNDEKALPLRKGDHVAVFGRCAFHYYKSGLGSGGLVNTSYVVSILDALKGEENIHINEQLPAIYEEWIQQNPIDRGNGWGSIPWSQKEMPITQEMVDIAAKSDVSLVIIGRTAGEDQDNSVEEGSYLLTKCERELIQHVSEVCKRTVVLLNTGNIIDMKWVEEYNPAAVLYVWQGGQEGGNGVLDVLNGVVNPCGRLTDTIAYDIQDYPSTAHFGNRDRNEYMEDIYVGYRYFETFAKEKVQYPFGYGLSYTSFDIKGSFLGIRKEKVEVEVSVTNTGSYAGKETVLLYAGLPQGKLGKPARILIGFQKTKELVPGESVNFVFRCDKSTMASYDETGVTGYVSAFVMEEGRYELFLGTDVRSAIHCGGWEQEAQLVEQLTQVCAPVSSFVRMTAVEGESKKIQMVEQSVPIGKEQSGKRHPDAPTKDGFPYLGNQGYQLRDVYEKKISMEQFISQLSDEELMCIFRGEGMCSPKVTPGTAAAFGGVTEDLRRHGIPVACCADGPSGIRMDCGTRAFSVPNGAAIGCSFNTELAEELFSFVGLELRKNKIDTLLGPGINIHRNPLNGRNFEYFSEDPLLTGKLGAAELRGLEKSGVTGTVKHFCCNNQEQYRTLVDAVVSERALREIYLKCFEIAVKEGNAKSIMTAYNPVNGIWASGNYELLTVILREEWNYKGIVMTDWWAHANWAGENFVQTNRAPMIIAQNDLFMCCSDALAEMQRDNVREMFENGTITRFDLQRNARNILEFLMQTPAMLEEMGCEQKIELVNYEDEEECESWIQERERYEADEMTGILNVEQVPIISGAGEAVLYEITMKQDKNYQIEIEMQSALSELAQLPVSVYIDNLYRTTISFRGTQGRIVCATEMVGPIVGKTHFLKLCFGTDGMELTKIRLIPIGEIEKV